MKVARLPGELLQILKEAVLEWDRDNVARLAAALAYYTVFSLAPLLVIAVAVAGFIFGEGAARGEIVRQIETLIGAQGAELVENVLLEASRPGSGILAGLLGLLVLIVGATGAFAQLQGGLNTVWEVAPRPGRVIRGLLRTRALSFAMVLGVGFLLLVSLVVTAALEAFGGYLDAHLPWIPLPLGVINGLLSFVIITLLFAMIYRLLPDAEIEWRDVWLGAAVTSLLFALGKQVIGLYLGNTSVGSAYGAAGTLAILLIWIYYSAHIFYFGAEITQVNARRLQRAIRPAPYATRMVRVRVHADTAPEARARAAAAVQERMEEPADSAAAAERPAPDLGPPATASHAAAHAVPARVAAAPAEASHTVAVLGPEASRLERLAAVVAGLLVGILVGALSQKRRVDVSREVSAVEHPLTGGEIHARR